MKKLYLLLVLILIIFSINVVAETSHSLATIQSGSNPIDSQYAQSFGQQVFYDHNNNQWIVVYADSSNNLYGECTSDTNGTTWSNIGNFDNSVNWYNDNFDCVIDTTSGTSYLHCIWTDFAYDNLRYKRCEIEPSCGTFSTCGTLETPYDASTMGQSSVDDISSANIDIDADRCILIAFGFEDDSEASGDEFEVVLIKEDSGTTCGDGDFDTGDIETGFPIYSLQASTGFLYDTTVLLDMYPNSNDAFISWIDSDSTTSADFEGKYFNGTSNTVNSIQVNFNNDIEYTTAFHNIQGIATPNNYYNAFYQEDGSTTVYNSYITDKNDLSPSTSSSTGIYGYSTSSGTSKRQFMDTVYDTDSNLIWLFSVESIQDKIYYTNSSDDGDTWTTDVEFHDGANTPNGLSLAFSNQTCDLMLTWYESTTFYSKTLNTGGCQSIYNGSILNPTTNNPKSISQNDSLNVKFEVLEDDNNLTTGIEPLYAYIGGQQVTINSNLQCAGTLDCSAYTTELSCNNCSQCNWGETDLIDYTNKSCNSDGSASDSAIACNTNNACAEDSTYGTMDSCEDHFCGGGGVGEIAVHDMTINGTEFSGGEEITVTCNIECFSNDQENVILYNNGSGWVQKDYDDTLCGNSRINYQATFDIDSNAGTHYVRCIATFYGVSGTTCYTTNYNDHDDLNFTVGGTDTGCSAFNESSSCSLCSTTDCANCTTAGCSTENSTINYISGEGFKINITANTTGLTGYQDLNITVNLTSQDLQLTFNQSNAINFDTAEPPSEDGCSLFSGAYLNQNCNITTDYQVNGTIYVNGTVLRIESDLTNVSLYSLGGLVYTINGGTINGV